MEQPSSVCRNVVLQLFANLLTRSEDEVNDLLADDSDLSSDASQAPSTFEALSEKQSQSK